VGVELELEVDGVGEALEGVGGLASTGAAGVAILADAGDRGDWSANRSKGLAWVGRWRWSWNRWLARAHRLALKSAPDVSRGAGIIEQSDHGQARTSG
jgi:hypothetical protein